MKVEKITSNMTFPTLPTQDETVLAALPRRRKRPVSVAHHNRTIVRGYKRADELEPRLARVIEPLLAQAGVRAARRFEAAATNHLTAAAPGVEGTSTMVALYPRPEEAADLEHDTGEPAGLLHLTLVYLGDTDGPLPEVGEALRQVAADHGPLSGVVGGIGAFDDYGDGHPAILLPDVPGLVELRVAVCQALLNAGVSYARNHGFTPHITVGYNTALSFPRHASYGKPVHFDSLHLVRGDETLFDVPLAGVRPLTADATVGWTAPAPDELVDVAALVAQITRNTDPIREAFIEAVMTPTLAEAGLAWDVTNPFVAKVLAQSGSQVTSIADTTRLNVMRIIAAAHDKGLSILQTSQAIQEGMTAASKARAVLIARTELAGAVNGGSLAATKIVQEETGSNFHKEWLTAPGASFPRHEDYDGLDGQTVPLDDYFDVGDDQLEYPGDPSGSPEEVCNCRCTLVYVDGPNEGDEVDGDG